MIAGPWQDRAAFEARRRDRMAMAGYMSPSDGKDCPCWERKARAPEASAERSGANQAGKEESK